MSCTVRNAINILKERFYSELGIKSRQVGIQGSISGPNCFLLKFTGGQQDNSKQQLRKECILYCDEQFRLKKKSRCHDFSQRNFNEKK